MNSMTPSDLLENTKQDLNKKLSEHLEKGIELLLNIIDEDSNLKLDIYQQRGKYNEIEQDSLQGVIKYDDKMFYTNKVRVALLEIIDKLILSDFEKDNDHWSAEEKLLLVQRNPTTTRTTAVSAPATTTITEDKIYTYKDLEIYRSLNSELLKVYPILYREISAIVYRGSTNNEESTMFMNSLNRHKDALTTFKVEFDKVLNFRDELRKMDKSEYYELMIKKFIDFKSRVNAESLEKLQSSLIELNQFTTQLYEETSLNS